MGGNCLFDNWLQYKRAIVRLGTEDQNSQRLSSCQMVNNKLSDSGQQRRVSGGEWDLPPPHLTSI